MAFWDFFRNSSSFFSSESSNSSRNLLTIFGEKFFRGIMQESLQEFLLGFPQKLFKGFLQRVYEKVVERSRRKSPWELPEDISQWIPEGIFGGILRGSFFQKFLEETCAISDGMPGQILELHIAELISARIHAGFSDLDFYTRNPWRNW